MHAMAILILLMPTASATPPGEAVESGRQALCSPRDYPWYDAANDGVRRIDVVDPPEPGPRRSRGGEDSSMTGGAFVEALLWVFVVAVLAAVVFLLVKAYLHGGAAAAPTQRRDADGDRQRIESLPFPVQAAQGDLLAEARRHRDSGRYGEAARFLFSHELVELDKHRLIRLARGKTNRQYLREIGSQSPLGGMVRRTMVVFEDYFFGAYTIPRERFEACWSELPGFEAELAGRST